MTDETFTNEPEQPDNVTPLHAINGGNADPHDLTKGALMNMLPPQIRLAVIGQYAESSTLGHSPEQFILLLEKRLVTSVATTTVGLLKELISDNRTH